MGWLLWLVATLVLGISEVLSVDLFFLMLAAGALSGSMTAALGFSLPVQVGVFSVVSVLLLFLVRPWAKRVLLTSTPNIHTNVHALVGQEAVVTQVVSGVEGRVRLAGEIWSARAYHGKDIPVDTVVRVMEIDGATAVVAAE